MSTAPERWDAGSASRDGLTIGGPSITAERQAGNGEPVADFAHDEWPLSGLPGIRGQGRPSLHFQTVPEEYRDMAKRVLWLVINTPAPEMLRTKKLSKATDYPSPATVRGHLSNLGVFLSWLDTHHDAPALAEVSPTLMDAYFVHVQSLRHQRGPKRGAPVTGHHRTILLEAVVRVHAHADMLPAAQRLVRPPWLDEDLSGLRRGDAAGGNRTQELPAAAYGPLLRWALLFVEDFSGDLLAALDTHARLQDVPSCAADRLPRARQIVTEHVAAHGCLPTTIRAGRQHIATVFLARSGGGGCAPGGLLHIIRTEFATTPLSPGAPLDIPVTARIAGRPWVNSFDYYDMYRWREYLSTACLIIIGLLSGARPHELLTLGIGAVRKVEQPNGQVKWIVDGRLYKGVSGIAGRPAPEGRPVTWVTTAEAAHAARILHQLEPGSPWAFPALRIGGQPERTRITTAQANRRIGRFIAKTNELADDHHLDEDARIPAGEDPITITRFRRTTLAIIADQVDGHIAAAHQGKHAVGAMLNLDSTGGYADTRALGQLAAQRRHDLAIASTARIVREVRSGAGISGPAAKRVADLAASEPIAAAGFMTDRDLHRALRNTGQPIYDNPVTLLACVFDALKAPGDEQTEPEPGPLCLTCPNQAMTDSSVEPIQRRIAALEAEAAISPEPRARVKHRLADQYRRILAQHTTGAIHVHP